MTVSRSAEETGINQLTSPDGSEYPKAGTNRKFMQTLKKPVHEKLTTIAETRGVTLQGLIRAVIIPEWMTESEELNKSAQRYPYRRESRTSTISLPISLTDSKAFPSRIKR